MMKIRKANERGHSNYGWLDSRHTFSFAEYHDPKHVHVSQLRVLNDDRVDPGAGFPPHPHRDMEIISYVLEGTLLHEDSLGHRHTLKAGEIQRMSAGTGIVHSEFNASDTEPVHFLQIWIFPDQKSLKPGYEIVPVPKVSSGKAFTKLVVPASEKEIPENTLRIHQDVSLLSAHLGEGDELVHELSKDRTFYFHLATGEIELNGQQLVAGDGITLKHEKELLIRATAESQMLLFDLP